MQGSKYKRSTKTATRIYNRFEFWSVEDCDCKYCPNFNAKSKLCPLDVCAIADIKQEAVRREQQQNNAILTQSLINA